MSSDANVLAADVEVLALRLHRLGVCTLSYSGDGVQLSLGVDLGHTPRPTPTKPNGPDPLAVNAELARRLAERLVELEAARKNAVELEVCNTTQRETIAQLLEANQEQADFIAELLAGGAEDEADAHRRRASAMHRRAQRAEGKLQRAQNRNRCRHVEPSCTLPEAKPPTERLSLPDFAERLGFNRPMFWSWGPF